MNNREKLYFEILNMHTFIPCDIRTFKEIFTTLYLLCFQNAVDLAPALHITSCLSHFHTCGPILEYMLEHDDVASSSTHSLPETPALVLQHLDGNPQFPGTKHMHCSSGCSKVSPVLPIHGLDVCTWLSGIGMSLWLPCADKVFTCVMPFGPLLPTAAGYLRWTNTTVAGTIPPVCFTMCKGTRVYRAHGQPRVVEAPTLDASSSYQIFLQFHQTDRLLVHLSSFLQKRRWQTDRETGDQRDRRGAEYRMTEQLSWRLGLLTCEFRCSEFAGRSTSLCPRASRSSGELHHRFELCLLCPLRVPPLRVVHKRVFGRGVP